MDWWHDLLTAVHATETVSGIFYVTVAVILGLPLRFVARLLESAPAAWLTRESTTAMVTFGAWVLCWFATRWEPTLNGAALYGTMTAVVVGPLLKRIMQPVDNAAEATANSGVFGPKK